MLHGANGVVPGKAEAAGALRAEAADFERRELDSSGTCSTRRQVRDGDDKVVNVSSAARKPRRGSLRTSVTIGTELHSNDVTNGMMGGCESISRPPVFPRQFVMLPGGKVKVRSTPLTERGWMLLAVSGFSRGAAHGKGREDRIGFCPGSFSLWVCCNAFNSLPSQRLFSGTSSAAPRCAQE